MADSRSIALAFMDRWAAGIDSLRSSIDDFFTDGTIWENVGLNRCVGPDAARAFIDSYRRETGLDSIDAAILNLLADDRRVMTERLDTLRRSDGSVIHATRIMGIFEIEKGRIVAQRDYFWPSGR